MIVRNRELLREGRVPPRLLQGCVNEHLLRCERLERLRAYYLGTPPVTRRTRADGMPNNRVAHGFARYIVSMAAGYLAGAPVRYADDAQRPALEALLAAYRRMDEDAVNIELAHNASLYGRAVELVYTDQDAHPRAAPLDPRAAFVVYDDTVQSAPLFGVYYAKRLDADGQSEGYCVSVCTAAHTQTYRVDALSGLHAATPAQTGAHYFGGVPMVEYWNNQGETGDFEGVTTLMDAYDVLQSDRVNDNEQLVNALLIIYGARLESDGRGLSPAAQLRRDKLLFLPDREAGAEYLTRAGGGSDAESLRLSLREDIHKFALVPDLTDEHFLGNVSGVAMKYKLLGLEQLTRIKERWFREGLRARMRLFANLLFVKGCPALDAGRVRMTFPRSLPANEAELAQMVATLHGIVPEETLLRQLPFMEGETNCNQATTGGNA